MDEELINKLGLDFNKIIYADNGDINYDGDIDLRSLGLDEIPIQFDKVFGNFYLSGNKIKSLKNSPKFVGGDFRFGFNLIEDLNYSPCIISGNFYGAYNNISSLHGIPRIIGRNIYLHKNSGNFEWSVVDTLIKQKNGRIGGQIYTEDQMENREETMIYINGKFNKKFSHLLKKED
jgi:hypothetical protein